MANFSEAYNGYVKPAEGYYVNNPDDYGGETYAGITRKYYPNWEGWEIVDFAKQNKYNGVIPTNTKINGLEEAVTEFYKALWNKYRIGEVESQKLANFLFDYIVNSGSAVKKIQQYLGVEDDGIIGPITLAAINTKDPNIVLKDLLEIRKQGYITQASTASQAQFLPGWLKRLEMFSKDLVSDKSHMFFIVIGLMLGILALSNNN